MRFLYLSAVVLTLAAPAFALDGQVGIHDPSTIILCDGKYYTYGTGGDPRVSDDGWTWRAGTTPMRTGAAPNVIHLGDRYYMYISGVTMISSKSLDPKSPDYGWEDGGRIAGADSDVDINPIDPGAFLDPTNGTLWLSYGSYVGYLQLVQLDPKTGKRLEPIQKPINIAINCEASDIIYHDGWYYLLATHGTCCAGSQSTYAIRMGRSKKVTGPYIDNMGVDMLKGGGKLFCGSGGRVIGPGHFGLIECGDGVQKFSCHYEGDLDKPGNFGVLDIRPLLWRDGWPVAGENVKEGTYEIESVRTGNALELGVEASWVGGGGRGGRGGGGGARRGGAAPGGEAPAGKAATPPAAEIGPAPSAGVAFVAAPADPAAPAGAPAGDRGAAGGRGGMGGSGAGGAPTPSQDAAQVSANWPTGTVEVRTFPYMLLAEQKWTITPVPGAGGYPGSPYFKVTIAGTTRTLTATEDGELVAMPTFTGGPEQLWRIEQISDGSFRIMTKPGPKIKEPLAISAIGNSSVTLTKYDPNSEKQRWLLKTP